jgi:hypothetical protein
LHGEKSAELTITEAKALERLGYHARWIESGILTLDELARQTAQFDAPDSDQHTEHYRCATLQDFLDGKQSLSDAEVASLLELGELDPEESVRPNFPYSLVHFDGLTDEQFEVVAAALDTEGFLRLVSRRSLLRLLSQDASQAHFDRAIKEGDADVHRSVLERPELARHHVELLAELGANKAVRNKAAELLKSRRFRQ